jgi:DNA replication protein DnaD
LGAGTFEKREEGMSIKLMSMVFSCNMPELKTDKGKTVPDTTAKFILLALADNANDEGEGSYPGVDTLCKKTGYSTATVCNALNALRHNGFTQLIGRSKFDTNNYTILAAKILEFQWLKREDFSGYNPKILAAKTNPSVKPSVKPSINEDFKLIQNTMETHSIGMNSQAAQLISEWLAEHEKAWIEKAIKDNPGKHQNYIDKILVNWKANGYPKARAQKIADAKEPTSRRRISGL